jgi:hypothetical protein
MGNVAELWLRVRTECGEMREWHTRRSDLERAFRSCNGDGVNRRNAEDAEKEGAIRRLD